MLLVVASLAVLLIATEIHAGCRTAEECVPIKECPWILNIFLRGLIAGETTSIMQQKICGYIGHEPKMCCENDLGPCVTPDQAAGFCSRLQRCDIFVDMLGQKPFFSESTVSLIRQSECEYGKDDEAKVCCPLVKPKQILTTTTTTTTTKTTTTTTPTPATTKAAAPTTTMKPREPRTIPVDLPLPGKCGNQLGANKIFGGNATSIDEFPWMALLEYGDEASPKLECGGSLITSQFVLTAAHCVHSSLITRRGNINRVRLGEYDLRTKTDCVLLSDPEADYVNEECMPDPIRAEVESIILHEHYSKQDQNGLHDIALIKLKEPVKYTDFVRPICLPINQVETPPKLYAAGWGRTETDTKSNVKLKVQLPLYDKEKCNNIYKNKRWPRNLGSGQLCAGGEPGKDTCAGDSGCPLMAGVAGTQGEIWFQFGLVSFGPKECNGDDPSVYTSVLEYIPWILDKIGK